MKKGKLMNQEVPICNRCKNPISVGQAYELGGDRWHVDCFACYKCTKPLSCDSDFLVLGTGYLICFECSDSCKNCGKQIEDLAIILSSSNEAYCSNCFRCHKCTKKMTDLRYAKTKKGLFCVHCHERLLAKKRYYEEKKRRAKKEYEREHSLKDKDSIPSKLNESSKDLPLLTKSVIETNKLTIPLDFSGTNAHSMSHSKLQDKYFEIADANTLKIVRSESNKVIAQLIDDSEYSDNGMGSNDNIEIETFDFDTPDKSCTVDNILENTLNHQDNTSSLENLQNSYDFTETNPGLAPPKDVKKSLLNRTPLRNMNEKKVSSSPIPNRNVIVLEHSDDSSHSIQLTPKIFEEKMNDHENVSDEALFGQQYKLINAGLISPRVEMEKILEHRNIGAQGENSVIPKSNISLFNTPRSRSSILSLHRRRSSDTQMINSLGHNPTATKNLARSVSIKSRNIMANIRAKTKTTPIKMLKQTSDSEFNMGWENLVSRHGTLRRLSDSTIYHPLLSPGSANTHKRSQSGSSLANIAINCTPPIQIYSPFKLSRDVDYKYLSDDPLSIGVLNEEDEKTPTNTEFLNKDIMESELMLRKLRLDIKHLKDTKIQLNSDVERLKQIKEQMVQEINYLKNEKVAAQTVELSDEIVGTACVKQDSIGTSISSLTKPRFWKIFGSNSGKYSSSSITYVSNKIGISAPVLQNSNGFDDRNLVSLTTHSECFSNELLSQSSTKEGQNLYGSTLVSRCNFEKQKIPMIMTICIQHIESKEEYLTTEGIYRKTGGKLLIEQIENEFAQSNVTEEIAPSLKSLLNHDIHAVTSVLKRYLRKLPNPILTFQIYESLISLVRDNQLITLFPLNGVQDKDAFMFFSILEKLTNILVVLPKEHQLLLSLICRHVNKISKYHKVNLMSLNNLALVLSPGIIRDHNGEKDIVDIKERNYLVVFIFTYYQDILTI